jgi:hypothetical protein
MMLKMHFEAQAPIKITPTDGTRSPPHDTQIIVFTAVRQRTNQPLYKTLRLNCVAHLHNVVHIGVGKPANATNDKGRCIHASPFWFA